MKLKRMAFNLHQKDPQITCILQTPIIIYDISQGRYAFALACPPRTYYL